MRIISEKRLRGFWSTEMNSESVLRQWILIVRRAKWNSFADVRSTFRAADVYKSCVIFDIGGNKYRLIAKINYRRDELYVIEVLTHKDYEKDDWKSKC